MDYKDKLETKPLLQCYQQDVKYQFKLCDYYISSSYMTPCVGNQHYDYISIDISRERKLSVFVQSRFVYADDADRNICAGLADN